MISASLPTERDAPLDGPPYLPKVHTEENSPQNGEYSGSGPEGREKSFCRSNADQEKSYNDERYHPELFFVFHVRFLALVEQENACFLPYFRQTGRTIFSTRGTFSRKCQPVIRELYHENDKESTLSDILSLIPYDLEQE